MKTKEKPKQRRGFAIMSEAKRIKIARMGGRAISKDRDWMAKIGAVGGTRSGEVKWERQLVASARNKKTKTYFTGV